LIAIFEYCIFTLQKNQFARSKVYVTNLVRKTIVNTRIVCWFFRANIVLYLFFLKQESYIILYLSLFFSFLLQESLFSVTVIFQFREPEGRYTHTHTYMMKKHIFGNDYDDIDFKPIIMTANSQPFTNRRKPCTPNYIG
jgi:hypothetical protein